MIAHIRGILLEKQPPLLTLEANGIGYEIHAPMTTFYHLPELHQEVILYTHLIIREDAHQLYGFHKHFDRKLFRALIKINGIGPKTALTILSKLEPHQFMSCIHQKDAHHLAQIPGIGKKTAERLVIEMQDSMTHWQKENVIDTQLNSSTTASLQDAIQALIALGYKPQDAQKSIQTVYTAEASSEHLIRLALQQSMKSR